MTILDFFIFKVHSFSLLSKIFIRDTVVFIAPTDLLDLISNYESFFKPTNVIKMGFVNNFEIILKAYLKNKCKKKVFSPQNCTKSGNGTI